MNLALLYENTLSPTRSAPTTIVKNSDATDELCRQALADLCHEVRTPVNGILGTLELLLERDLSDEVRDLLVVAYDATRQLHGGFEDQVARMYLLLADMAEQALPGPG